MDRRLRRHRPLRARARRRRAGDAAVRRAVLVLTALRADALARLLALIGCAAPPSTAEAPAPPLHDPTTLRFLAIGDAGKANAAQAAVAQAAATTCAARGCDFVALLGDNLYPDGLDHPDDPRAEQIIAAPFRALGVPLYLVLGNHDYGHTRGLGPARWQIAWAGRTPGVELPAHAWYFRAGPATVVGLDTNHVLQFGGSAQLRFLAEQLGEVQTPWRVVLGHHPYRSDGPHGNAGAYEGWRGVPILSGRSLRRLFDEGLCARANLYLSGHDHNRQLLEHCGVPLIVSGAGAGATEIVDRGNEPRFGVARPGLAWVELGPQAGQVVFIDALGVVEGAFPLHR